MSGLRANFFGRFRVERDGKQLVGIEANKPTELLTYLLIFRDQPQPRETLSELLWRNFPPARSKKYLRQTLWKLKSTLEDLCCQDAPDLLVEADWIQLNPSANWWLDIAVFEQAFTGVKNKRARELSADEFLALQQAADLYRGDLLEGWYQDWCIFERERFRTMYLMMLNMLIQYCEIHQQYNAGVAYGEEILHRDRAYERAHRQLMRLYYKAGDRTQALRQYERCVTALQEELGVTPSERTVQLYEQIKANHSRHPASAVTGEDSTSTHSGLEHTMERLDQFSAILTRIQSQIQKEIVSIENRLQTDR